MKNRALFIKIFVFLSVILTLSLHAKVTPPRPKISVIIPTFNREKLLPRAINSILNQTFQNFEIIVVDDASTDNTKQILKQYQKISRKIKVITHATNQGVSAARNTGNSYASGTYIAIMDSDDFARPDFLKTVISFMDAHPTVTIGIPFKDGYREKFRVFEENPSSFPWNYPVYDFLAGNHLGNVGNVFRRDFILKHNIKYNPTYSCGEDYDFWMQMILKGAQIASIPSQKSLIVFRLAGGLSLTGNCTYATHKITTELYQKINYTHPKGEFDFCTALDHTIQTFPDIFLPDELQKINHRCHFNEKTIIHLIHPKRKTDTFFFSKDNKTLYSKTNGTLADVVHFKPQSEIILKWEKWGEEIFIYDHNKNRYILKK